MNKIIDLNTYKLTTQEQQIIQNVKDIIQIGGPLLKLELQESLVEEERKTIQAIEKWEKEALQLIDSLLAGKGISNQKKQKYFMTINEIPKGNIYEQVPLYIAATVALKAPVACLEYKNYQSLLMNILIQDVDSKEISNIFKLFEEGTNEQIESVKDIEDLRNDFFLCIVNEYRRQKMQNPNDDNVVYQNTKWYLDSAIEALRIPDTLEEENLLFGTTILTIPIVYESVAYNLSLLLQLADEKQIERLQGYSLEEIFKIQNCSPKEQAIFLNIMSHYNQNSTQLEIQDALNLMEQILYVSHILNHPDEKLQDIIKKQPPEKIVKQIMEAAQNKITQNNQLRRK